MGSADGAASGLNWEEMLRHFNKVQQKCIHQGLPEDTAHPQLE
eukprot:NODE_10678_length_279_cov_49.617391_g8909_i0.p4 GENE.NODE_10678_length_279_cov_49.617391_g8909_i0~~NODE_10678_length_279_cov_49.617391_g8909_i0.p4  ORF type:complete len:51 (-),score=17.78 NODE_10678_length_279_cov_49.617391_g8909_i0:125-253(-)